MCPSNYQIVATGLTRMGAWSRPCFIFDGLFGSMMLAAFGDGWRRVWNEACPFAWRHWRGGLFLFGTQCAFAKEKI